MRLEIRLAITLSRRDRREKPEPQMPETFESQGSLVETRAQPRYVGFEAVDDA